jgi:hypothetical protein
MSKRGEKIAAKMADRIIRESGTLDKSHGSRQQIISTVTPIAEAIAMLDKSLDKHQERVGKWGMELDEWVKTDNKFLAVVEGNSGVDPHLHPFSDIIPPEKVVKMRTDHTVSRQLQSIDDALRTTGVV